jgi:hypothetical protein
MIPDDALKIEVLHHRIIPFDNRDKIIEKQTIKVEIAKLRCANHTLKKGIYDVHTISPHRTVKYVKNGPHKDHAKDYQLRHFMDCRN